MNVAVAVPVRAAAENVKSAREILIGGALVVSATANKPALSCLASART
jgi:hypothetical protein